MRQVNLGQQLARCAKRSSFTVAQITQYTGATRCTVYNWLAGKGISPAYRTKVTKLIEKLSRKIT